jgi:transposase-like protein
MTRAIKNSYAGHRFPPELISYTVWLYFLFPLSLRMVAFVRAARLQCIVQSMASGDSPRTSACRAAILNLHERMENKLFLDRTRKDSNFKRPYIYATLFQIEKCCPIPVSLRHADKQNCSCLFSVWSRR